MSCETSELLPVALAQTKCTPYDMGSRVTMLKVSVTLGKKKMSAEA